MATADLLTREAGTSPVPRPRFAPRVRSFGTAIRTVVRHIDPCWFVPLAMLVPFSVFVLVGFVLTLAGVR